MPPGKGFRVYLTGFTQKVENCLFRSLTAVQQLEEMTAAVI